MELQQKKNNRLVQLKFTQLMLLITFRTQKYFILALAFVLFLSCNSEKNKFNGRWSVYSEKVSNNPEPYIYTVNNKYFLFRNDGMLISSYENNYSEYWGSDKQDYKAKDSKLIIYMRNSELEDNIFKYKFINDTTLSLIYIKPELANETELTLYRIGDK